MVELTEKWCQEKALHNAIHESILILGNKDGSNKGLKSKGEIPKILSDALSVSFDPRVGHDYIEDYDKRFEFYHRVENKIPFDIDYFNTITNGGLSPKTLTVILAGTNVGKSLVMCHFASAALAQGYNVLYITLEMAEEKIASRIDANLLNIPLNTLMGLSKDIYDKKIERLKERVKGKLIIKEYPPASVNANHFKHLLNELHLKKQFKPDIIFVDYINLCTSSRIKPGNSAGMYAYVKAIAEELRGIAVEQRVPLVSATQTNRSGYTNTDPGLEDTSESFGLPATADLMFALVSPEELESLNQIMIKQLKNRDNDLRTSKRGIIGIDRSKMRLYNVVAEVPDAPTPQDLYKEVGKNKEQTSVYKSAKSSMEEKINEWNL